MALKNGLILYVHGARDPRWAEPFIALCARVRVKAPDVPVSLAFLEHGTPNLADAAALLAGQGAERLRVALMFFGRGGHLREDFPRQLAEARRRVPGVEFEVTEAAAEDGQVLEALSTFALQAPARSVTE